MPSEHLTTDPAAVDPLHLSPQPQLLQAQIKLCATCLSPLAQLPPATPHDPTIDPSAPQLCPACRERTLRAAKQLADADLVPAIDVDVRIDDPAFSTPAPFAVGAAARPSLLPPSASSPNNPPLQPPLSYRSASPTLIPALVSDSDADVNANISTNGMPALALVTPPATPPHVRAFPAPIVSARPPSPLSLSQDPRTIPSLLLPCAAPTAAAAPEGLFPSSTSPSQSQSRPSHSQRPHMPKDPDPDPLCDITRLRVRSHSRDCLYPGAQFSGTQKSGRSSYEVSVNIVDVDFSLSFLCGYLRIRGLTDDWPELTTYFDAQIIGQRYGFLTDEWGASESQDMTHWDRFPAFHHVRRDVRGPKLLLRDPPGGGSRSCVFMRWKERFLVPDHRVRDINGASFAGFYYVCVEFNPRTPSPRRSAHPATRPSRLASSSSLDGSICAVAIPEEEQQEDRDPSDCDANNSSSDNNYSACDCDDNNDTDIDIDTTVHGHEDDGDGDEDEDDTATMSGFYFHQNSEPYQQLSLRHVPSDSTGVFEFR